MDIADKMVLMCVVRVLGSRGVAAVCRPLDFAFLPVTDGMHPPKPLADERGSEPCCEARVPIRAATVRERLRANSAPNLDCFVF